MQKLWILLLSLLFVFSVTGCGNNRTSQTEESTAGETESQLVMEESSAMQPESSKPEQSAENESNILIAYFSRWGNTEYPDDVDATTSASIVVDEGNYGTTEYVARMIQENVGGDLHLIQTQEPYPADFEELRDLNHSEMAENYLPVLVESNLDISKYDTVFIGYPVWAAEVPQAVIAFLNKYDLTGKTVVSFCTHDGYGAGGSYETIRKASHAAELPEGLAIEAKDVPAAENTVAAWLEDIGTVREGMGTEGAKTPLTMAILLIAKPIITWRFFMHRQITRCFLWMSFRLAE